MKNKKQDSKSSSKIVEAISKSLRPVVAELDADDLREALELIQHEIAKKQETPVQGVIIKNLGNNEFRIINYGKEEMSIAKGSPHIIIPESIHQPIDEAKSVKSMIQSSPFAKNVETLNSKTTKSPSLPKNASEITSHQIDTPIKVSRIICFEISNNSDSVAEAEIDATAVDPRGHNGITIVLRYLNRGPHVGFQEVSGRLKLEIRSKERIQLFGLGFDLVASNLNIFGRSLDD